MSSNAYILFDNGSHKCISFSTLVKGEGVQANQFLIIHDKHAAVIDPGGDLTYTPLTLELMKHIRLQSLDYVIASHQDPDIIASMPR
ncbi:MAG TPA: MBL fold metallo-hydrolase, partial [Agitococcus sp.]|nr:MBL fold metallo-hydrolase [Agitococcus sp.]